MSEYEFVYSKGLLSGVKHIYIHADRIENAVRYFKKKVNFKYVHDISRIAEDDYSKYKKELNEGW